MKLYLKTLRLTQFLDHYYLKEVRSNIQLITLYTILLLPKYQIVVLTNLLIIIKKKRKIRIKIGAGSLVLCKKLVAKRNHADLC